MSFPKPCFSWRPHLWNGLEAGSNPPQVVHAYIEITPFDFVKYEIDKTTGYLRVDRPQRLQRPLVARIVGGHAEDEQGRQDTEHPSHSAEKEWQAVQRVVSPRGDVGPVGLAPFSVSRNFTMRRTSLAGTVRLSWLAAISPTAASSVAARPS